VTAGLLTTSRSSFETGCSMADEVWAGRAISHTPCDLKTAGDKK